MTTKFREFDGGEMRVCNADELLKLTGDGWVLVETVPDSHITNDTRMLPPRPPSYPGESPCDRYEVATVVIPTTRYLLARSSDTALAELRAQLDTAANDVARLLGETNAVKKKLDQKDELLEAKDRECGRLRDCEQGERYRANGLSERVRKMEADLAKLRRAIGDLKFNEIVDADKLAAEKR